jgi:hypothetical protein
MARYPWPVTERARTLPSVISKAMGGPLHGLQVCVAERDRDCPLAERLVPFPLVCSTRHMRPPAPHHYQDDCVPAELIPFEQLFEVCLDCPLVATTLHRNVEDVIVLIHGPPQVMASAMDGQNDVAELPIVSRTGPTTW